MNRAEFPNGHEAQGMAAQASTWLLIQAEFNCLRGAVYRQPDDGYGCIDHRQRRGAAREAKESPWKNRRARGRRWGWRARRSSG